MTIIEEGKAKATRGGQRAGGEESGRENGVHIVVVSRRCSLKRVKNLANEKK